MQQPTARFCVKFEKPMSDRAPRRVVAVAVVTGVTAVKFMHIEIEAIELENLSSYMELPP